MSKFDFKSYHIRAINAATEEEKKAINQELKAFYASLPSDEQKLFNEELQSFLIKEMAAIKSVYDASKN